MNHEQLAFFNQQLAAMLKSGLPLESSLKQLSLSMRRGRLRDEIQRLEAELEQGIPLDEALGRRKLPELYVAMLRAGLKSNDLPGVLTQVADYYNHLHTTWLRLKGLMVYPGILLVTSFLISTVLAVIYTRMIENASPVLDGFTTIGNQGHAQASLLIQIWLPVLFLGFTTLLLAMLLSIRRWRHFARWKLPGFREASLSQLASTLATMLEHGANLDAALEVAQRNELHLGMRLELAAWRQRLAQGARSFSEIARSGPLAPALFVWLVTAAGENWAHGFRRAAEVYDARSKYRVELALLAALPVMVLLVAGVIGAEMTPLLKSFLQMMRDLGEGPDMGPGPDGSK